MTKSVFRLNENIDNQDINTKNNLNPFYHIKNKIPDWITPLFPEDRQKHMFHPTSSMK